MGGLRTGCLVVWLALCALPALGAEPDPAKARAEANAAADQLDAHRYADALDHAKQAEALFHAPSNMALIARAHEGLGQLVEAMATYEKIAAEPLPASAPDAFRDAQAEAKKKLVLLMARIPSLLIAVHGDASASARIEIDGKPYDAAAGAVRLDPGKHAVRVTAPGFATIDRPIELPDQGGVVTLDLTPTASDAPTEPDAHRPSMGGGPPGLLVPGVALLAVGGAALIAGAAVGGVSLAKVGALRSACRDDGACPPEEQSNIDAATTLGNASTALVVIGALGAATGATLLVVRAVSHEKARTAWSPWIGFGMVGVRGSFE